MLHTYKNNTLVYEININKITTLQNMICDDRNITPNALKKLIMFNFEEQVLSNCYYESMFLSFLEKNNYQNVNDKDNLDINNGIISQYDALKKQSISSKIMYKDIPLICDFDLEYKLTKNRRIKKQHD